MKRKASTLKQRILKEMVVGPRRKRLVRGKDWHAWVWKAGKTWENPGELFWWAEPEKPTPGSARRIGSDLRPPTETGKWVRVKFIEAAAARKEEKPCGIKYSRGPNTGTEFT